MYNDIFYTWKFLIDIMIVREMKLPKFEKTPNMVHLKSLLTPDSCSAEIDGEWVPARPVGYWSFIHRIKCAWKVFSGQADALIWPGEQ